MKLPKITAAISAAALIAVLTGCGTTTDPTGSTTASTGTTSSSVAAAGFVSLTDTHAESDDGDYDPAAATTVTLAQGASTVDGAGASVKGDVVTITSAGTYILSGSLSDGQVVVNSTGEGQVKLVLDGADITSSTTSPVVITAADEAVVILADGSTNTLTDSAASAADDAADDAPTATLFSMADLTIAGTGALHVTGASNDAISSKDGLVILSGTIDVQAADDGIRGKDYLVIEGGTTTVNAGGDGLKSDNATTGELGWIQVDAGDTTINGGSQGADAVGAIKIADGTINVATSEEGLQAAEITIAGGTVDITASDDGLNATSHTVEGGGEEAEDGVLATISGGTLTVTAGSDGIDSNGSATITGGTVAVSAQGGGGGNGAFDVNGTLTAPAIVTIDASSVAAGDRITITDSANKVIASWKANGTAATIVVSSASITSGGTYTVYTGTSSSATSLDGLTKGSTVTATDASQAATSMGGGGHGPGGGGRPAPPMGPDATTPST
jgi:hypothetical protein